MLRKNKDTSVQQIAVRIEQQDILEASEKLDEIRKRTKPTSTAEIVSWIREDRDTR